jgi:hypothetical protein
VVRAAARWRPHSRRGVGATFLNFRLSESYILHGMSRFFPLLPIPAGVRWVFLDLPRIVCTRGQRVAAAPAALQVGLCRAEGWWTCTSPFAEGKALHLADPQPAAVRQNRFGRAGQSERVGFVWCCLEYSG